MLCMGMAFTQYLQPTTRGGHQALAGQCLLASALTPCARPSPTALPTPQGTTVPAHCLAPSPPGLEPRSPVPCAWLAPSLNVLVTVMLTDLGAKFAFHGARNSGISGQDERSQVACRPGECSGGGLWVPKGSVSQGAGALRRQVGGVGGLCSGVRGSGQCLEWPSSSVLQ